MKNLTNKFKEEEEEKQEATTKRVVTEDCVVCKIKNVETENIKSDDRSVKLIHQLKSVVKLYLASNTIINILCYIGYCFFFCLEKKI